MKFRRTIFGAAIAVAAAVPMLMGTLSAQAQTTAVSSHATSAVRGSTASLEYVGEFIIKNVRLGSAYCLDDSGTFGLRMHACNNESFQHWWVYTNGIYVIVVNTNTDRCLDDSGAGMRSFICNSEVFQQWYGGQALFGSGEGRLQNADTGLWMNANPSNLSVYAAVFNGSDPSQVWEAINIG